MLQHDLIDHPRRSTEDSDAEGDLNCESLAQEVSDKKNFSLWPTDCSCDILVKIVAAHALVQKKVPVAKLKDFGLIMLAKEISKQSNINSVVQLLVVTFVQTYKQQEQAEQGTIQNVTFEEKRSIRKCKQIRGNPDAKLNKGSSNLRARLTQLSFQFVKGN